MKILTVSVVMWQVMCRWIFGNKLFRNCEKKKINIVRAHLEQDAGKLIHDKYPDKSCIDFNRSGSVLLEIVTAPEIHDIKEVELYLRKLSLRPRHYQSTSSISSLQPPSMSQKNL